MKVFVISLFMLLGFTTPANAVAPTATCDGLTITADPGTRVLFGIGAEPPMQVNAGETKTFPFFKMSNDATKTFAYTVFTLSLDTDEMLSIVHAEVPNCPTIPFPAEVAVADPPVPANVQLIDPIVAQPEVHISAPAIRRLGIGRPW